MVNTTGCGPVGMSSILVFHPLCPCDGNGRHIGLRNQCVIACEFESHQGYFIFPRVVMDSISTYEVDDKSSTLFEEA